MDFWIRNAVRRDTEGIVSVVQAAHDEYGFAWDPEGYHADLYDVEANYWRAGHAFWVAETLETRPRIVGTCGLHLFDPVPMGGDGTLEWEGFVRVAAADCALERMYVHPSARRAGVGSTLMVHSINFARDKGRKRMEIWSDKKLEDAHRLYERFGAIRVGERLCHDPDQSPEWGMVLPLRQADGGPIESLD